MLAQHSRTVNDGVYTSAQARRGEALYQGQCVVCHGPALAGELGPPLTGQDFLSIWHARPLFDLFDKIHNTMPPGVPRTLARPQVADLVAYILESNQFPAGDVELATGEAALKEIALGSGAELASAAPVAPNMSFPAVGNMNQLMRGILFPSSNLLFDVQTQDPGARSRGETHADVTSATGRYGDVYDPWVLVDVAAISLAEVGPLLMMQGRRCENGKPVPVGQPDWQEYVQELVEAGRAAYRASQSRSQAAVAEVTDRIADACANCHVVYRDTATAASRCTPP